MGEPSETARSGIEIPALGMSVPPGRGEGRATPLGSPGGHNDMANIAFVDGHAKACNMGYLGQASVWDCK